MAAAPPETSTPAEDTTPTTTTEPDDDDKDLASQPAGSQDGWGPAQVAVFFVLGGLLALGEVALGRRRRG